MVVNYYYFPPSYCRSQELAFQIDEDRPRKKPKPTEQVPNVGDHGQLKPAIKTSDEARGDQSRPTVHFADEAPPRQYSTFERVRKATEQLADMVEGWGSEKYEKEEEEVGEIKKEEEEEIEIEKEEEGEGEEGEGGDEEEGQEFRTAERRGRRAQNVRLATEFIRDHDPSTDLAAIFNTYIQSGAGQPNMKPEEDQPDWPLRD